MSAKIDIFDSYVNDVKADFKFNMASSDPGDDSLYPIAVLIDELRNEDVQVLLSFSLYVLLTFKPVSMMHQFLGFPFPCIFAMSE